VTNLKTCQKSAEMKHKANRRNGMIQMYLMCPTTKKAATNSTRCLAPSSWNQKILLSVAQKHKRPRMDLSNRPIRLASVLHLKM